MVSSNTESAITVTYQDSDGTLDFAHNDTSSVSSADLSGGFVIQDLTIDTYGHVTGIGSVDLDSRFLELSGGTLTGNIVMSGSETVDGRDLSVDGAKLDNIESNATADQTASEILTLLKTVDGAGSGLDADTLDGISSASFLRSDADDTTSGNLTIAKTDPTITLFDNSGSNTDPNGSIIFSETGTDPHFQIDYNGANDRLEFKGRIASTFGVDLVYIHRDSGTPLSVLGNISVTGNVDGRDVASDGSKLDGIESGATADQTASEIRTLVESASDSNVFTDADHSKLNAIEASADVTDTTNVVAALTAGSNITIAGDGTISSTDTNTQLSTEQVQDIVGAMVSSNTETGITVAYQDGDGTIDFSVTPSSIGLGNVTNESKATMFTDAALTGNPTAPTQSAGNDSTRIATTAFVSTAVANLVDSAPSALNTLNELAAALGDDASFSTTVTNSIATKLPLAGGSLTGGLSIDGDLTLQSGHNLEVNNSDILLTDNQGAALEVKEGSNLYLRFVTTNGSEEIQINQDTNIAGDLTLGGGNTVDGRDVSADGTKLDGIEASADVTDTANVVAALTAGSNISIAGDGTISATDTNTQLSNEQVQDIVGAMVSSNTESGITVTYQDGDGTIDFSVASQTDNNFTNADHTKLDGIEASADVTDTTNVVAALTAGSNITIAGDGTISSTDTNTQLSTEQVQDIVGAMVSSNTESAITVTYQDSDGTLDFAHNDTSSVSSADLSGGFVIQDLTVDTYGHVTGIGSVDLDSRFLELSGGTLTGNIVMSGSETVDGRDLSVDGAKLDGIESGATADQTASEIRTLVESASDSNVFTDADHSKLNAIEASADVTDTANVVAALTAGSNISIAGDGTISSTDTNTQLSTEQVQDIVGAMVSSNSESGITVSYQDSDGTLDFSVASQTDNNFTNADHSKLDGIEASADVTDTTNVVAALTAGSNITIGADGTIAATDTNTQLSNEQVQDIVGAMVSSNSESGITVTYQDSDGTLDFSVASQTDNNFTDADHSKLDGIEASATADQTASEIRALVESASDSNVFTDADHSKLNGIEASADVTDTTNVVAALTAGSNITIAGDGTISSTDTNTQLSTEQVQDIIGAMVSSNTESGITVTYQDGDGTIDFSVASQTDNNFTNADHTKLDGIEASADVTDTTNVVAALTAGSNITIAGDGTISSTDTNTQLSDEQVQDIVGAMVSSNTESGITVTYQDSDGTIDFSVASQTDNNFTNADHTKLDGIEANADVTDITNIQSALGSASAVGIGTAAPATTLEVAGPLKAGAYVVDKSADFTLSSGDNGTFLNGTSASFDQISITGDIAVGFNATVVNPNGDVDIVASNSMSINGTTNGTVTVAQGYQPATILRVSSNTYMVFGNLL